MTNSLSSANVRPAVSDLHLVSDYELNKYVVQVIPEYSLFCQKSQITLEIPENYLITRSVNNSDLQCIVLGLPPETNMTLISTGFPHSAFCLIP